MIFIISIEYDIICDIIIIICVTYIYIYIMYTSVYYRIICSF